MPVSATILELAAHLLSPSEASPDPSASRRSLSGLIAEGKIEARKHGPRTPVAIASRKPIRPARRSCSAATPTCCRASSRDRGTDAPMGRIRT